GSNFKVCWAGKLVIGDHVTGFLIIAAVGAASGLIQISSARPSPPPRAPAGDLSAPKRGVCRGPANPAGVNPLLWKQGKANSYSGHTSSRMRRPRRRPLSAVAVGTSQWDRGAQKRI